MKPFLDTNVLLYLFSADTGKADRAEDVMASGAVVSVQVLNEFVAVARRKLTMSWTEIAEAVQVIEQGCAVEPLTMEVHHAARRLAEQHKLAWYDALIVASALAADCDTLYSEDLHDGMRIEKRLRVRNPFAAE
ncbi:MAG TPA: PIN domain-containing protein [Burkholderiaceae bacterium]|nr:PIN domain-containing protein [Burkholderiaceae bacterium]